MRQGLPSPPRPLRLVAHGHRVSSERRHFCRLSLNVRPMAIASPRLFICVVSVGSACGEFLEGKARNLGDDVIYARLEARGGFARDVVLEFIKQVADGEFGDFNLNLSKLPTSAILNTSSRKA
jgi:hypothetical protein